MPASQSITIIIADDHPMIRQMLKLTILDSNDLHLIGEAGNAKEAMELCNKLKPDIIITDIKMPGMSGIELTKELFKNLPQTKIIALSMIDDELVIIDMLEAGARGYLLKDVFAEEVIKAIRTVHEGEIYLSKGILSRMVKMVATGKYKIIKPELSTKEIAIIKLICQEKTSKEIADELQLSKKAVDGLRDNILRKIDVKNTAGLVSYAIKNKIYDP